jgi:hypothetical protein
MKKNVLAIATLGALSVAVFWGYYYGFNGEQASANPDFICVKSVTGQSCDINSCDEWQNDGTRVCHWKRATKVWYYHTRTTCESGYSSVYKWATATDTSASTKVDSSLLDDEWKAATYKHPSSWRHSDDYTYENEDCEIIEVDDKAPSATVTSSWTSIN